MTYNHYKAKSLGAKAVTGAALVIKNKKAARNADGFTNDPVFQG
ncbi:hypothetical protein GCM10010967_24860 [Dyadobacter beijingensis]|uniref:Uncharacterized protein n=1 Tax=Dyadobacter beijingensis TaxID=365489 RepID=A0ABQ2HVT8_9BACT|nr:hypothetical protein [Dyadobacter beijingensis]GGM90802.1 hypothetical protein GCM10010967_24860 [Dyadobacter beijingensis]